MFKWLVVAKKKVYFIIPCTFYDWNIFKYMHNKTFRKMSGKNQHKTLFLLAVVELANH